MNALSTALVPQGCGIKDNYIFPLAVNGEGRHPTARQPNAPLLSSRT